MHAEEYRIIDGLQDDKLDTPGDLHLPARETIQTMRGAIPGSCPWCLSSRTGLLVKVQDDHPVDKMICMDVYGFPWIWDDFGF